MVNYDDEDDSNEHDILSQLSLLNIQCKAESGHNGHIIIKIFSPIIIGTITVKYFGVNIVT